MTEKKNKHNSSKMYASFALLALCTLILYFVLNHIQPEHINVRYSSDINGIQYHDDDRPSPVRRRLSIFNGMKSSCKTAPKIKQPSTQGQIPPTYFATYPGSGSRVTRKLIMALTGLKVQSEYSEQPKDNAIAVQTKFPHRSGALCAWDRSIQRTIMLIRSPMHALPSLFDELYTTKKHLPVKFHPNKPQYNPDDEASVAEWISWRDRMFESQMISYSEFVRYWTTRHRNHDNTLILAYEDLMNEQTGSDEAERIVDFLSNGGRGDGGPVPTVDVDDVPCVWQTIFRNANLSIRDEEEEEDVQRRRLASYIIPHPSSIEDAPESRLFTSEQLRVMATVLSQVAEELQSKSHHLNQLLLRYRSQIIQVLDSMPNDEESDSINTDESINNVVANVAASSLTALPQQAQIHIFSVSPPGTESNVVTNWLLGLFEQPDTEYTHLVTTPGMAIYQNNKEVPITTTIVTQTNEMNVLGLYKIYKPGFDEVFFVVSKSGTDADKQIDSEICEYENLLCIEYEDQQYTSDKQMRRMVRQLTDKLQYRFATFLGGNNFNLSLQGPITRLIDMQSTIRSMQYESYEAIDSKYGVHGGLVEEKTTTSDSVATNIETTASRRLFYCGSTGSGVNINYSILGIFLANSFFPEFIGGVPGNQDESQTAIQLTTSSINQATDQDFLVYHMHQYCEVDVLSFPGMQLHVNHPTHGFNAYGKYIQPAPNIYTIGAYEDGPHSIQLPYAMMKWWVLVKGLGTNDNIDQSTLDKFFNPSARPKNTGKHFLLYVNSHYVAYRELAALTLSSLGTIHATGSCQGNIEDVPTIVDPARPPRCIPFKDDKRPSSIKVTEDLNKKSSFFNRVVFQDYRFMLLMEDANLPGYITERIVDGFMSGTVPIYYGDSEQIFDIFNAKAFIYYDINAPQEALDRIKYLEENSDAYQQMLNEPILANGQETIDKYFSFEDSIGNGILKNRVRTKLGFPI